MERRRKQTKTKTFKLFNLIFFLWGGRKDDLVCSHNYMWNTRRKKRLTCTIKTEIQQFTVQKGAIWKSFSGAWERLCQSRRILQVKHLLRSAQLTPQDVRTFCIFLFLPLCYRMENLSKTRCCLPRQHHSKGGNLLPSRGGFPSLGSTLVFWASIHSAGSIRAYSTPPPSSSPLCPFI